MSVTMIHVIENMMENMLKYIKGNMTPLEKYTKSGFSDSSPQTAQSQNVLQNTYKKLIFLKIKNFSISHVCRSRL